MPEKPDKKAEKKPTAVDDYPPEVRITAEMVRCGSEVRSAHARMQRLSALARTNRDVAWLMEQAEAKKPAKPEKPDKK